MAQLRGPCCHDFRESTALVGDDFRKAEPPVFTDIFADLGHQKCGPFHFGSTAAGAFTARERKSELSNCLGMLFLQSTEVPNRADAFFPEIVRLPVVAHP